MGNLCIANYDKDKNLIGSIKIYYSLSSKKGLRHLHGIETIQQSIKHHTIILNLGTFSFKHFTSLVYFDPGDVSLLDVTLLDVSLFEVSIFEVSIFEVLLLGFSLFDFSFFDVSLIDFSLIDLSLFDVSLFDVSLFEIPFSMSLTFLDRPFFDTKWFRVK